MISEGLGLVVAAAIGSFMSPLLSGIWRYWKSDRPRKKLLKEILNSGGRFKSLSYLSRTIGASDEETRRLLVEIGARGAKLKKSGNEGWALISRAPLNESLAAIEATDSIEDKA